MPNYALRVLTTGNALTLDLTVANGYVIKSLAMPALARRRDVVASPDMTGEVERQSVLDAAELEVQISCRGANDSAAWTAYDTLASALNGSTRRFRVETTMRGRTEKWEATRAKTWRLNSDPRLLARQHHEVSFVLPIFPLPV